MNKIFQFGEKVAGFSVPVLNEREARASAGILFFFAMISLFNVMLIGNFTVIKIFIIAFTIEFLIRVFINPKYAPVMVLGRLAVSGQKPEYTGAHQKRFAWSLGLGLAALMLASLVFGLFSIMFSCVICIVCVLLLFFESAFGICLGCHLYNLFTGNKAELCPGGICEVRKKEDIQKVNYAQLLIILLFFVVIFYTASVFRSDRQNIQSSSCFSSTEQVSPCSFGNDEVKSSPCSGATVDTPKPCPF
ncbi:DUF4395 domain-containing protein [Patescibacteria group bacterium]|nr:DUF4395 domain-containing protein [Patescibacteria group bacterium]